jgi:glycosyltransferase involved in cell wall biosynthesis
LTSDRPFRVLVVASTFPRWQGDTEPHFVLELCERLADSFQVTVLAPSAEGAAETECMGKVKVVRYRYAPLKRWERLAAPGAILPNIRHKPLLAILVPLLILCQFVSMIRLIRREHFDVIHCNWIIPQGFTFALLSHLIRTPPAVLTCLGADAYVLNGWPMSRIKAWILGRFDRVTVISTDIRRELVGLVGSARTPPMRHIPIGVDLARFGFAPRLSASNGKQELLFVGRLAEKKGLQVLLAALMDPRLAVRTDFRLTVVGDGPLRRPLEAQAAAAALRGKVTFVGALPHDELGDRLRSAHIFCAPFVVAKDGDREGMPAVVMEAAATGLPMIASDVGGVRDIVENGVSGWLLPPGDPSALAEAILDALDHPDKRAAMGLCLSDRAKRYS